MAALTESRSDECYMVVAFCLAFPIWIVIVYIFLGLGIFPVRSEKSEDDNGDM